MSSGDTENIKFVKCDGGRSASAMYPTLKPLWMRRDGMRFKLVQDCCIRAVSVACEISYDEAFHMLEAEPDGAVLGYDSKLENRVVNGWRITLVKEWRSTVTRHEFPRLFPAGRFLCSEHGNRHLVAYIDGVRYGEGLPLERWRMSKIWGLSRVAGRSLAAAAG